MDNYIRTLLNEPEQLLAVKLDLILHHFVAESIDYVVNFEEPFATREMFYGSYSGLVFNMPVDYENRSRVDKSEKELYSFERTVFEQTIEFSDYLR